MKEKIMDLLTALLNKGQFKTPTEIELIEKLEQELVGMVSIIKDVFGLSI